MSRSDFPPSYDDSRLLSNTQPGPGYPPSAPPYGFSPYEGQPGYPQPNDPYRGQPNDPYRGQPNDPYRGQPNDPYRGQPAGYPPPAMPVIPVMPPPGIGDSEGFTTAEGFESTDVRHSFIRKVYLILAAQLLVTAAVVAIFTFVEPVGLFVRKNPAIYWVSYAIYFVTHIVLVCCQGPRRRFPWNLLLLAIFTLALSFMTGNIASYYSTRAVFLALAITVVVCVAVTVFCFQTKVPWLHMLYASIGAIAFTLFLAYHTQLLIGNRKLSISPEEYVFAALSLYVDIVQIFIFLLQIIGYAER